MGDEVARVVGELVGRPRVILELARGARQKDAAAAAGVDSRTVRQWMTEAEFRGLVESARSELLDRGIGVLAARLPDAIEGLYALGGNPKVNDNAKVAALRAIVDQSVKLNSDRVQGELARRIAAVEEAMKDKMDKTLEFHPDAKKGSV